MLTCLCCTEKNARATGSGEIRLLRSFAYHLACVRGSFGWSAYLGINECDGLCL